MSRSSGHRPEPATARIAGRSITTTSGSVHCVALELRKERQGRRGKATIGATSRMGQRPASLQRSQAYPGHAAGADVISIGLMTARSMTVM